MGLIVVAYLLAALPSALAVKCLDGNAVLTPQMLAASPTLNVSSILTDPATYNVTYSEKCNQCSRTISIQTAPYNYITVGFTCDTANPSQPECSSMYMSSNTTSMKQYACSCCTNDCTSDWRCRVEIPPPPPLSGEAQDPRMAAMMALLSQSNMPLSQQCLTMTSVVSMICQDISGYTTPLPSTTPKK